MSTENTEESRSHTERKEGARVCETVFGDDWAECVSPKGRKTLKERVESGIIVVEHRPRNEEEQ